MTVCAALWRPRQLERNIRLTTGPLHRNSSGTEKKKMWQAFPVDANLMRRSMKNRAQRGTANIV
jgi:hypothetical protein